MSKADLANDYESSNEASFSSLAPDAPPSSRWTAFKDSFKRADIDLSKDTSNMTDLEKANHATASAPLAKSLKNRHIQGIAIGGSVGTGLLIGSGGSLRMGGPASLLIAWGLVATMIFVVIQNLGELTICLPISGSNFASRFVSLSWGFAVGYNYALMWLIVFPLELVAAGMTIQYWNSSINPVAWVAIFYVFILGINFFGVRGYGEAEFALAMVKVVGIVGFIILGVILVCGGGPNHDFVGSTNWHNPGPFTNGFKGVCSVFVTASYSLAGTELIGLAAASETSNPRKSLPKAVKQVFVRIILFYILSLTFVGLLVPSNSPELLGASSYTLASPFVISIKRSGIKVLPSIFNAVILLSVMSVANSAVYGSSRTIQGIAAQGFAPQIFAYVDRRGRPLGGLAVAAVFGLLCFLSAYKDQGMVFNWLLSISGLATVFMYFNIALCHVRFRFALKAQGERVQDLAYTAFTGLWGSIYAMVFLVLVLVVQFWVALFPTGGDGKPNARSFFQNYLGAVVIAVFYFGHRIYLWEWTWYVPLKDIDLRTGRVDHDTDLLLQEVEEERHINKMLPWYRKVWNFWC